MLKIMPSWEHGPIQKRKLLLSHQLLVGASCHRLSGKRKETINRPSSKATIVYTSVATRREEEDLEVQKLILSSIFICLVIKTKVAQNVFRMTIYHLTI